MKILYVANHGNGGNDEEGSIAHALRYNGHEVVCLPEALGHRASLYEDGVDFILFHKWNPTRVSKPLVMWYFDLVDYTDSTLEARNHTRRSWMTEIMPRLLTGFCTDGDWVKRFPNKLKVLRQGVDLRVAAKGESSSSKIPILMTGINRRAGVQRQSFVDEMYAFYKDQFECVTHGVHGQQLANLIASADIVVAPDGPVTDHYWSNRVYLSLGFQAFLLHPWCNELACEFQNFKHLVFYKNRQELVGLIQFYSQPDKENERLTIAKQGWIEAISHHSYQHRCETLIEEVSKLL